MTLAQLAERVDPHLAVDALQVVPDRVFTEVELTQRSSRFGALRELKPGSRGSRGESSACIDPLVAPLVDPVVAPLVGPFTAETARPSPFDCSRRCVAFAVRRPTTVVSSTRREVRSTSAGSPPAGNGPTAEHCDDPVVIVDDPVPRDRDRLECAVAAQQVDLNGTDAQLGRSSGTMQLEEVPPTIRALWWDPPKVGTAVRVEADEASEAGVAIQPLALAVEHHDRIS